MGVPKFYRWVSERYPLINEKIGKDTQFLPKFDNMYLDMNGIIHTCTHPNDEDVSDKISKKDMVLGMFSYVDRMVHIVKPQKVLMLAVDGCAPRAKMNQQRSRRFASAKDRREGLEKALREGTITEEEMHEQFDSNCITPGTEFMEEVSQNFQYFVRMKIKEDPLWRNLKVVYSGHDVPGEGEHKIMDYIRHTRMQPGYDPNTRHCLCGLDADLIMLGLASHEPHFALLREEVDFTGGRGGKKGGSQTTKEVKKQVEQDKWELLHLSALRQYLDLEMHNPNLPFGYDLERIIDDWVLLVMLVGNDFLPHLPSLSIAESGLDDLMAQYRKELPSMGGYITENGKVSFDRLERMLQSIASKEKDVFEQRVRDAKRDAKRQRRFAPPPPPPKAVPRKPKDGNDEEEDDDEEEDEDVKQSFEAPFAQYAREKGIVTDNSSFKEKYYGEKFGVTVADRSVLDQLVLSYIEGIQWCYLYYYQGVQSWTWFFPFHYAPLASDLKNLSRYEIKLTKGQPFKPFMQLLGCLPSDSAKFLPTCYRELMTLTTSPLADFYPREFNVDMNGKRNAWEGVNLLPFIDEKRLVEAVREYCPDSKLTEAERSRNTFGEEKVFQLDVSITSTVPSSFPEAGLPDIEMCQTSAKRFTLPAMARFDPNLLPGAVADGRYPGDPQLTAALTLRSDKPATLDKVGMLVFNRPSAKESLVLNVRTPSIFAFGSQPVALQEGGEEEDDSLAAAVVSTLQQLQDQRKDQLTVFVDFPNLREAQVVAVADDTYVFTLIEGKRKKWSFSRNVQTEEDSEVFMARAEAAEDTARVGARVVGTGGLDIGEVVVMLKVRPLLRMDVEIATGAARQVFAEVETWVPYQLVCFNNSAPDPRFVPRGPLQPKDRFPIDSKVMCLQKVGYGLVGKVVGYEGNSVKATFKESPQIPPFGHTIASSIVDQFISSHKAARHLNIDPGTLGKVAGSILVRPGRYDIGLNLKVGRSYIIPGYVRSRSADASKPPWSAGESVTVISGLDPVELKNQPGGDRGGAPGGWEYAPRALELIAAYKKKFPEVFRCLAAKPNVVEHTVADMFGSGDSGRQMLDQVCKWLEQIDTFRLPLVPITSKTMSRDAILAVQRASDDVRNSVIKMQKNTTVNVKLSPDVIFKYGSDLDNDWLKSPTAQVPPRLGDRVVNMGSPVVPFGLGGTVVATHASTGCVEVLFDAEFIAGTSLYGACAVRRGKLLPWSQLLNMSKRMPLAPGHGGMGKVERLVPAAVAAAPQRKKGANLTHVRQAGKARVAAKHLAKEKKAQTQGNKKAQPSQQQQQQQQQQTRFVVPPATVAAAPAAPMAVPVPTPTDENSEALNALAGAPAPEATDDLAQFWLELQGENKAKRKSRRKKGGNKKKQQQQQQQQQQQAVVQQASPPVIQQAPPPVVQQAPPPMVQQAPSQAKPMLVAPTDLAPSSFSGAVSGPPAPPAKQDPLDDLFKRAAAATGKEYKAPTVQQPPRGMPFPPPQGMSFPPPPPQHFAPVMMHPMQHPAPQQQQQQQQQQPPQH
ncbi:5'-3' exoribonuclease 1 (Strand-exchange protein 1 homolog) [Durusdinium trenchii]|uniref:5'-3' exoribonuclease 1 n=1 Tax=Durusdinium trenchii TaxID=1381693 RepID=A0ABP0J286_9DINO